MGKPGNTGIRRILMATRFSFQGLAQAWRFESAFRQEVTLAALMAPFAFWLGENATERVLLLSSLLAVLIVELLNSAIEATVDRIGGEPHMLAGRAKDMGSAAVFISLVLVALVWGTFAFQRLVG